MTRDVLGLAHLGIGALGREHVTVVLGDQVGNLVATARHRLLVAQHRRLAAAEKLGTRRVVEVVHRIDVFEELALLMAAHAAGLPRGIEFARDPVGLGVEVMVVGRLIDAHAPEDDRRVVPVALDHAAHVADRLLLPALAADVLPARNLLEDEEPQLIATIEEVRRLRVVRRAHQIALEDMLDDLGVLLLRATAHRITDVGIRLMPVEAANLERLAVEDEAFRREAGAAETETCRQLVAAVAGLKRQPDAIQARRVELPEREARQVFE